MTTSDAIGAHRETALDSPYSRDREEAIEELARAFPGRSEADSRAILETLREVMLDATSTSERELAREKLLACFDEDPDAARDVVVPALCELAESGKFKDDQIAAIDALREVARDVPGDNVETVRETLSELASDATSEDVRSRARRRLTDLDADGSGGTDAGGNDDGGSGDGSYLGVSLAEHLQSAAGESAEACRKRAVELLDYVADHQVDDEAYDEVREDLDALVEQLDVVPTGDELGDQRRERVERIAERTKRLYQRDR
jgi:hypothetical protein